MATIHSRVFLHFVCIFTCYLLISSQDVAKLPYCNEEVKHPELILVSTLDGIFTALTPTGSVSWQIETGPGPLLSSNIHKLELTNNGQWIRIIPSLSGSLYKFDGITIDAIPISADTLLTSSFRYSDDLVIAGGREVRTYGVLLNSGKHLYECSLDGCKNTTDYSDNLGDIIIIERITHTVRAVEPRTGIERWNFSVGQHDVKIPYISCVDVNSKSIPFNLSAVLPEGLLIANNVQKSAEILWQYKFEAPIVTVWKWNGRELIPVNLFSSGLVNTRSGTHTPSIYVGMHNKQLYVHESSKMQNLLQLKQHSGDTHPVVESRSLTQIPWKPVPATGMSTNMLDESADDSTALSVLYASEYVNGNGYYLYTEEKPVCESNVSIKNITNRSTVKPLWYWWKEVFVVAVTTIIICNVLYNYIFKFENSKNSKQDGQSQYEQYIDGSPYAEFVSRYMTEFEPVNCLGKGGFGVVFQAKKRFDECDYAVKRITLPNKPTARDRMMREVKALAKLDHRNIVRYYNAWLEYPPSGWQKQHDQQWLSVSSMDNSLNTQGLSSKVSSLAINVEPVNFAPATIDTVCEKSKLNQDLSWIVFKGDSTNTTALQTSASDGNSKNCCERLTERSHSLNMESTGSAPAYLYIQMQLCCKESLKDWLNSNPQRDRSYILDIFQQIVDAVEYVHFRGLIHRDLKPSNIFFSLEGQIKVGDFGLVTSIKEYTNSKDDLSVDSLQKSYTNAVGTQLYMSPEQLNGQQYNYKVDIYSLGIIFFELLVPFKTEMERVRMLTDIRNNIYPEDFAHTFFKEYEVLNSMLAADPEKRPTATATRENLSLQESCLLEDTNLYFKLPHVIKQP